MRESRLRELLADLVADVDSPPMTQRVWQAAQRSRRQRLVVGVAAAGVLLAGAGAAVADGALDRRLTPDESSSVGPPVPSAPASAGPRVQAGPAPAAVAGLPHLPTRFAALSSLPSSAGALSKSPVSRIVAAVQPMNGPVFVLDQDGSWREADRGLGAGPGEGLSLISTSISPDARRLALARTDGLLLIDATTGNRRLVRLPGTMGHIDGLFWLPDGNRVAVVGDGGEGIVSTTDGSYRGTPDQVHDLAVSGPDDAVVRLTDSELVVQDGGATVRRRYGTGDQVILDEWYDAGWVSGSLAARTGFLDDGEQATFVIDVATARATQLLTFATGGPPAKRSQGCCPVLGWLDAQTVLVRDGGQVLAWRFGSGVVYRVARLPGTAQGSDLGYGAAIALAQS
ncbi:MAG TPA: hypothetical protein VFR35_08345 [Actinoplanes sp.]|nr:hypothetical protein [Actinoplanes sp.]